MRLRTTLITLAEGAVIDTRGLLSIIAAIPSHIADLPTGAQAPYLVVSAIEETDESPVQSGETLTVRITVTGPDGATLFLANQGHVVSPKADARLPHRFQVIAQVPVEINKPGTYRFSVTVTKRDEPVEVFDDSVSLTIVEGQGEFSNLEASATPNAPPTV